jgi:hypothetical protein
MEPAWIPNGREHEFFAIKLRFILLRELFILWYPDEFIISTQVKSRLVEGDTLDVWHFEIEGIFSQVVWFTFEIFRNKIMFRNKRLDVVQDFVSEHLPS